MSGMWVGSLLAANRLGRLPFSASTGNDDSPRTATRRRPLSSKRRKVPVSARQRRVALSRMASKMGCKSCGELAMARSTSEMAVCCSMSSVTRSFRSQAIPPGGDFFNNIRQARSCLLRLVAVTSSRRQAFGSKGAGRRSAPWRASIQPGYSGASALTSSSFCMSPASSSRVTAARF